MGEGTGVYKLSVGKSEGKETTWKTPVLMGGLY
jgi:hypothetical protein